MFKSIKPKRVSDQVFEQLKELIYRGDLVPGEQLMPERELVRVMGVSRSSIREALNKLVQIGLLVSKQGQGTFVASFSDGATVNPVASILKEQNATVEDLLNVRLGLECNAASMAAQKGNDEEIARIEACRKKMEEKIRAGEIGTVEDSAFHMAISYATGNPLQVYLMKHLYDFIFCGIDESLREFFDQPHRREDIITQHQAIVKAIRARDGKGASEAMGLHINYIIDYFGQTK